ncbi:hypothetical protein KP509_15G055200 [Ceratopteris richardii]|uniref:Myb/SANT-like DNA-binding domain-containing protein n=1 Tax=Ceratopteris richardii TaxID=49495 RepID=A0A8T2T3K8_CERRI|nr:hypothetical protein KP509_15G055200 [Ceratopteris richardii]
MTLIKCFEEVYLRIRRGNLRTKDWDDVTNAFNKEALVEFTSDQVRNRIDTLKKQHKKESKKQSMTGSIPSARKFFDLCECIWGATLKVTGLQGAFDSDAHEIPNKEGNDDPPLQEEISIEVDAKDFNAEDVKGKRARQQRRNSLENTRKAMMEGVSQMICALKEMNNAQIQSQERRQ